MPFTILNTYKSAIFQAFFKNDIFVREWQETVYDLIKDIGDPEKPETLEELDVVKEELVRVTRPVLKSGSLLVSVEFVPTVPHCSLATLIGLCIRTKLDRNIWI